MDNETKIKDLEQKNQELERKIQDFSTQLDEIKNGLETHTHSGNDGSTYIYGEPIKLKPGAGFSTGKFGFVDYQDSSRIFGFQVVGDGVSDSGLTDSIKNTTQLTIEHQPLTNGSSNNTFYYGYRSPLYASGVTNGGKIVSGGTTLTQSKFEWETNELDGAFVLVKDSANSTFDVYEIASNTSTVITITGGTWTFSSANAEFVIFVPVYLGSADFPWRRIYTTDGSGGGIRFGMGDTNGGQNALLYTDGTALKFRKKDGTVTTVTVV